MIRKHYLTALATLVIATGVQWVSVPAYATHPPAQSTAGCAGYKAGRTQHCKGHKAGM